MQTLTVATVNRHIAVCQKCWRTLCCCRAGHIIVDYTMVDILRLLNKKGYKPLGIFTFVDEDNKPIYSKVKFLKPDGKKETP